MKKFYESPIVEFTVFDVEDVITTSAVDTANLNAQDLEALITEINNSSTAAAPIKAAKYGSTYSW